jgi:hypothetical protein
LGSFERVSAMDLSQRPARKEEADVLAEDGQDAVGDGVPPVTDDLPVAAQFDVDLPRMSPPFSPLLAYCLPLPVCMFSLATSGLSRLRWRAGALNFCLDLSRDTTHAQNGKHAGDF